MSGGLIKRAVPTDKEAVVYLKSSRGEDDLKVTPLKAKSMYPDKIKNNKHFKCPTEGCDAPITCRSIRKTNVNQPAFVDQYRSINKHAGHCRFHPDNYEKSSTPYNNLERQSSHYDSGNTFSKLTRLKGFVPAKESTRKENAPHTSKETGQMKKRYANGKEQGTGREKKKIFHHLVTLQEHVELFIDDPEFKILTPSAKQEIPIKYMFKNISQNVLYRNLADKSYLNIYSGRAFLAETGKDNVLAIRFRTKVKIGNDYYRPSMIISKEHFRNEYEDIYEEFVSGSQYEFEVYTTLPLILNGSYLNFSSYMTDASVNPFGKELHSNFYIR